MKSSRWIAFVVSRTSASSQIERAKPIVEINSSIVPYASTRSPAFETRSPPMSAVIPVSPCFVAMLMSFVLIFREKLNRCRLCSRQ